MKMYFKQRMFKWFDSYDIYDEQGNTIYTVEGQLSFGHMFKILDAHKQEVGAVHEKLLSFLPKFELYRGGQSLGYIKKELTFFVPKYDFEYTGWHAEGSIMQWDYEIYDQSGNRVASISKELFHLMDTYNIDVEKDEDALLALMFVLAIDAEKCSRNNS